MSSDKSDSEDAGDSDYVENDEKTRKRVVRKSTATTANKLKEAIEKEGNSNRKQVTAFRKLSKPTNPLLSVPPQIKVRIYMAAFSN